MSNDKRMLDREALRSVIQQWNANRLDLFELSEPNENLEFHGVMRFYFQDTGQKVATKCIRVASDATVSDVIKTLIEKFRPDMRMLSVPNYAIYEVHSNGEERKLNPDEKPLLVQLNWHVDDREGRFLLRNLDAPNVDPSEAVQFKRKLSKREKKEQKKKEKLAKHHHNAAEDENHVAEKLYTELPETSFTRSISNPEAVMRRRRQQKLEKKLQQFRSKDGGPDTGGTLKIYGESLCRDVPYKTLLLSIRDCAQAVVREMLAKYGMDKADPLHYCLVQVNSDGTEYILDDDECPLSILMNHQSSRGSIMFHVRRRPADSQPRRRKKKPLGLSNGGNLSGTDREGPTLIEVTHSGDGGRRVKLTNGEPIEVGSANTNALQIFGPSIQARHCLISLHEGVCTVTPLHADAITFVNGHHITQPTILHNGSVVMFGRGASYRFVDPPADGRYNLALSQSQLDSAYLYESRTPTTPTWHDDDLASSNSMTRATSSYLDTNGSHILDKSGVSASVDHLHHLLHHPLSSSASIMHGATGNGMGIGDSDSIILSTTTNTTATTVVGGGSAVHDSTSKTDIVDNGGGHHVETDAKSISSNRSAGSTHDASSRMAAAQQRIVQPSGKEPILPAVLEFPEIYQENFLEAVITDLDVNAPNFKLAPVYTLYLCARYRASTHYRTDLTPTERAENLTAFLHQAANMIYNVVCDQQIDRTILAFWIANASEFLHFLKSDRHISAFSVAAQDVLRESVDIAFANLIRTFHVDLSATLSQFLSENIDHDSAARLVLSVLGPAMALMRQCRVNAAFTCQLYSQLFHYISVVCFNKFVTTSHMCTSAWGNALSERLARIEIWAQEQGLDIPCESYLSKINQCAHFLQAPKTTQAEIHNVVHECFQINSLQTEALLSQETIPRNLIDAAYSLASAVNDEIIKRDGRQVTLEEPVHLPLPFVIPDVGFSCDVVRGIPAELVDFIAPLEAAGMCRLAPQPTSIGKWTVYMHQFNARSPSVMSTQMQPEIHKIKLNKSANGMGLSIVAAKGAGQERLGIYIKSVVPQGAADLDGRLKAGDQLLSVDGHSLIGITQEKAADFLVRTGKIVTLEVGKQGAIHHGLATLLQKQSPILQRGRRPNMEFDTMGRSGMGGAIGGGDLKPPLPNSKSVPALHHGGSGTINHHSSSNKSRSINNLMGGGSSSSNTSTTGAPNFNFSNMSSAAAAAAAAANSDQGFYQNLSVYRAQSQNERAQLPHHSPQGGAGSQSYLQQQQQLQQPNRPSSNSYYTPMTAGHAISQSGSYALNHMQQQQQQQPSASQMTPTFSHPNLTQAVQQQQQQQQQQALLKHKQNNVTASFIRESQGQHSMRGMMQNQMLAPSMPNIAHSSGYATSIQASQSMQNVNAINGGAYGLQQQQQQQQQQLAQHHYVDRPPMDLRQQQQNFAPRGSSMKGAEMINEMMSRRSHPAHSSMEQIPYQHGSPQKNVPYQTQQQQQQIPPGGGSYNRTMSPLRQLPPTAPKPPRQMATGGPAPEDLSPPLPMATHPLYKQTNFNYVASTNEPPKAALYTTNNSGGGSTKHVAAATANPWEREEREKEQEVRREHVRMWRDQQIVELTTIPNRSQQQEEQLKTLLLERDFERRALEEQAEEENELLFHQKDTVEVVRLTKASKERNGGSAVTTSLDSPKTAASPVPPPTSSASANTANTNATQPKSILKQSTTSTPSSPSKQKVVVAATYDKSQNLSEITMNNTNANQMMSALTKNMTHMSMTTSTEEPDSDEQHMPPPPPERNSSYVIMAQQAAKLKNMANAALNNNNLAKGNYPSSYSQAVANAKNNNINSSHTSHNGQHSQISPTGGNGSGATTTNYTEINFSGASTSQTANYSTFSKQDNKRVSFHDEENNVINSPTSSTASGSSDNGGITGIGQAELAIIREDPNKFIDETQAILHSPTTPEASGEQWNLHVQSTPGVIGAQEVYRDPRQRRLAEQQKNQAKTTDAVPEKLSFKEKMKMFALETGEGQTPKDKLKISRAQRDIDAVH